MEKVFRRAVRVICLDDTGAVLLMRWRDPHDGAVLWEPPGGGVDPGEDAHTAACRELAEETGFDPDLVGELSLPVERDVVWRGRRFVGTERFFLARVPGTAPAPDRGGLLDYEEETLLEYAWIAPAEMGGLERLEPPNLEAVTARLAEAYAPDEDAVRFVADRYAHRAGPLRPLGTGAWSRAYAMTLDGRDAVARFGPYGADFDVDASVAALAAGTAPVPRVLDTGAAPGGYFAVTERARGDVLEDLDGPALSRLLPRLLDAFAAVRALDASGFGGYGPIGEGAPYGTWAEALSSVTGERERLPGWRASLEATPTGAEPFDEAAAALDGLAPGCPGLRQLVHTDTTPATCWSPGTRSPRSSTGATRCAGTGSTTWRR